MNRRTIGAKPWKNEKIEKNNSLIFRIEETTVLGSDVTGSSPVRPTNLGLDSESQQITLTFGF